LAGSSSNSTSARAARTAASIARARWPPERRLAGRFSSVVGGAVQARVEVVAAPREPLIERVGVLRDQVVVGRGVAQALGERVHAAGGRRDAEALVQRGAHGPGIVGGLIELGQVQHARVAGADDAAAVGCVETGQQPHQRRLAAAVGPDQGDLRAVVDGERHAGENRALADRARDVVRGQQRVRHGW
jgi:hypothetical protein